MVDRMLLAGVLGIGLGLVFVAFPALIIRVHTAGRVPTDKGSDYGEGYQPPGSWLWVVRAVGLVMVVIGLYFGASVLG